MKAHVDPEMVRSSTARMLTERLDECRRQIEFFLDEDRPEKFKHSADDQRLLYWRCEHAVVTKCILALEGEVHQEIVKELVEKQHLQKKSDSSDEDWN